MKKILSFLLVVCLLFSLSGCDFIADIADNAINDEVKPKTFEFEGISIELTTEFLRMDFISDDYEFVVGNGEISVFGMKLPFEETELGECSVQEIAEYFHSAMEEDKPTEVTQIDGIPTFQYSAVEDGETQTIAVMMYKAKDCFWMLLFGGETDDFYDEYDEICRYAKSVKCV